MLTTSSNQYPPKGCFDLTAAIASGQTTSAEIDLLGTTLCGFILPSAFTGTALGLQMTNVSGGTYVIVQDGTGVSLSVAVTAGVYVPITNLAVTAGLRFVKVVSNATEGACPLDHSCYPARLMGHLLTLLAKKQPTATKYDFTGGVAPSGFTYARLVGNATYFGTDGLLHTAAANTLRFGTAGPGSTQILGALLEPLRTNLLWSCRDLTQSNWTKTNCTVALDSTGIDGAASSASSITATSANATVMQTVTQSATKCAGSVYLRRRTGVGTIQTTQDGANTWTTDTLTSSWTRFATPVASTLNPGFGVKVVTSGDVIEWDYGQLEAAPDGVLTHPVYTDNTGTAQRRGDNYKNTSIPWFNAAQGTMIVQSIQQGNSTGNTLFYASLDDTDDQQPHSDFALFDDQPHRRNHHRGDRNHIGRIACLTRRAGRQQDGPVLPGRQ